RAARRLPQRRRRLPRGADGGPARRARLARARARAPRAPARLLARRHVSLRYAADGDVDPRVHAIAAICPPIDLRRGVDEIDKPKGAVYRRHVLSGLKEMYVAAAKRAPITVSIERALAVRKIREWDDLVVAPRFGFANANDYYDRESVGPRLKQIDRPTLVVVAEEDPMVFSHTVRPWLDQASNIERIY